MGEMENKTYNLKKECEKYGFQFMGGGGGVSIAIVGTGAPHPEMKTEQDDKKWKDYPRLHLKEKPFYLFNDWDDIKVRTEPTKEKPGFRAFATGDDGVEYALVPDSDLLWETLRNMNAEISKDEYYGLAQDAASGTVNSNGHKVGQVVRGGDGKVYRVNERGNYELIR